MITYHFKRSRSSQGLKSFAYFLSYFKFLSLLFLFLLLDIINIPRIFNGEYHLFLFEIGIFYFIFIKKSEIHYLTIFAIYLFLDLLHLNYIGTSFLAIVISVAFTTLFMKLMRNGHRPLIISEMFLYQIFYLFIFIFFKLTIVNITVGITLTQHIFTLLAKSAVYTSLLFLNICLIFRKNLL